MEGSIFYGVSTGPGDPELMSVKAVKTIEKCNVIAAPRTPKGNTMALDIVKKIVDVSHKEIIYTDFAMSEDMAENSKKHDAALELIKKHLDAGRSVAMLSIGDISLYSTFSYVYEKLKNKYKCVIIPGVNSFSACAAAAGVSLTDMKKPLTILPGSCENIDDILSAEGTKIIMKSKKGLGDIINKLDSRNCDYIAVQNCGLENEIISHKGKTKLNDSYFTTILVKE